VCVCVCVRACLRVLVLLTFWGQCTTALYIDPECGATTGVHAR
jgi:hypothetical protein